MSNSQKIKNANNKNKSPSPKTRNYTHELIKWGGIVFIIWLIYLFAHRIAPNFIVDLLPDKFRNDRGVFELGTFGDYFGALNALFAGLAFAGIIVTIRQQSADLQATKDEMSRQTGQFKRQNEQERINAIKSDIHNRILLIKQFEKDLELNLIDNGKGRKYTGTKALQELTFRTDDICLALFPDTKKQAQSIVLTNIAVDLTFYAESFAYIDAWLNNIYLLLEDIRAQFNELKTNNDALSETREFLDREETRCYKIVLNSILQIHLTLLYFFHDTHSQASIIIDLQKSGLINPGWLSQTSQDILKRNLFYELVLCMKTSLFPEENIRLIANKWRKAKGWEPLPPLCTINPSLVSNFQYICPTGHLLSQDGLKSQIHENYAKACILSSISSESNSEEAIISSFRMESFCYTPTKTGSEYFEKYGGSDTLLWIYSTMQRPSLYYYFAGELQAFYIQA